jgi:NAD(P)-dependent dehydrogenase (short-subunit alcohol dehydrogenase family)
MDLKNAVALVTGGGSGLGEATARELAAFGAKIAVLDLGSSPGQNVAASLDGIFVAADVVSDKEVAAAITKTVAKFGSVHITVNCAASAAPCAPLPKKGRTRWSFSKRLSRST